MRYKCTKCCQFHWLTAMHFAKCKECNFIAARCDSERCGGLEGATRSLTSHVIWYKGRGTAFGFEDFHKPLPSTAKPKKPRRGKSGAMRLLKLVS